LNAERLHKDIGLALPQADTQKTRRQIRRFFANLTATQYNDAGEAGRELASHFAASRPA
jgi:hypothetical protein